MESDQVPTFGTVLRRFRLEAGLSQEALAERARLSPGAISALERGARHVPQRQTLALLSTALELSPVDRERLESVAVRASRPRARLANDDDPAPDNLPLPLTSFHGRERDIALLCDLIAQRRLVSLCGVGGVGKTRLAIETARTVRSRFTDGALLVELAAIVDSEMVLPRIAAVAKVQEQPGQPLLETLTHALREQRLLLVLDNCEHLLDGAASASQRLLEGCAQLHVLTTSREPLRVPGERVHAVAPLALPQPLGSQLPSVNELLESPAIRLFFDRAADVLATFGMEDEGARRSLLAICERLDGLPLAIELAAARTNALGLAALEAQLDDRFRILTGGARTAHARQQTLRATLDWSYALLSQPEQIAFRRLGIFVGGWTLEAARAVCADGNAVPESDVLALLGALIGKSLVVAEASRAQPRYRLLETMHAYALERLAESNERGATARRHFEHFRNVAEHADETLGVEPIQVWLAPLRTDLDNFRAALHWAFGEGECPTDGAALVAAFGWTFGRLSFYIEGQRWCERALEVPSSHADHRQEARLLVAMMVYGYFLGFTIDVRTLEGGLAAGKRAIDLYRELEDRQGLPYALPWLGVMYTVLGRREEGEALATEGVAYARALGDGFRLALGLVFQASVLESSDVEARRAVLHEALDVADALHDDVSIANAAFALGVLAEDLGETGVARDYLLQSIDHYERVGYGAQVVNACGHLAWCSLAESDTVLARDAARKAIARRLQLQGNVSSLAAVLSLSGVAVIEGAMHDGARLLGAAKQMRGATPTPAGSVTSPEAIYEFTLGRLRSALPEDELQALMREGATWSSERTFAEALRV